MVRKVGGSALALSKVLSEPIYNKTLRKDVGRGELDYEVYLRTRELLALQTPSEQLVVPDELLFQVMHQTQELWLKCAAFEIVGLVEYLDADKLFHAVDALDRIVAIMHAVGEQIRVMFTLSPARFQVIRKSLGNGSGLESPGYNQLLVAADEAEAALRRAFERRSAALEVVYSDPDTHRELHTLAERFVDWDSEFQGWLFQHFQLVRRTIGVDKTVRALDGFPTVALGARMTKPLFPGLWHIRVQLTAAWNREGGHAVGVERGPSYAVESNIQPASEIVAANDGTPISEPVPSAWEPVVETPVLKVTSTLPPIEESLREEFPVLAHCTYLNSNATGATPRGAKRVLDAYWRTIEAWRDENWTQWMLELEDHATSIANLIGAPPGSVHCDTNLSTLLSRVLSCFAYRDRPKIVTTDLEFPSLPFVVSAFSRLGAEPVVIRTDGVAIDPARVCEAIDERTRIVCLSHATFATGALLDVAPIVQRARECGAFVALDAYQSIGVAPVDVRALDVDFLLGGAHKWLCGSYESAFLYVRPSLLPILEPAATGWIAAASPLTFGPQVERAPTARRFAGGTPAVLPSLFSRPGLDLVRAVGIPRIRELSLRHTAHIMARADDAGLAVVTPREPHRRGGIVALRFPGDQRVATELIARGLVCSYRGGIRIAPHFYNTLAEIDRFMDTLEQIAWEKT